MPKESRMEMQRDCNIIDDTVKKIPLKIGNSVCTTIQAGENRRSKQLSNSYESRVFKIEESPLSEEKEDTLHFPDF